VRPARVREITVGAFDQELEIETSGDKDAEVARVRCRWLVDASGRACVLGRKLGLVERNERHPTAALWARWHGVRHVDDLAALADGGGGAWAARNVSSRRLATNHYVGRGFWVWFIPLGHGETSIGIVWDKRELGLHEAADRKAAYLDFLAELRPANELLAGATMRDDDFRFYSTLAYATKQYMGDGWALVGDAAAFLDPYYSPGLDHVGFSVEATTQLVLAETAGRLAPDAIARHNEIFVRSYWRFFDSIFEGKYKYMGEADLLSAAMLLEHSLDAPEAAGAVREAVARALASGARTAAFVSAFVLNRRFGLARGFAAYDDEIVQRPGRPAGMEAQRPGRETVDRALAWLDANAASGAALAVWVHLFDAHAPYEPPEPFASTIAEPYDGEIAEVDAQLGRLLAALEAKGLAEETLVAVAGDHGEALGDHGERSHGLLLYEPTLRVPLVLRGRGLPAGAVVRSPVSLVDLAPTLLDLLALQPLPLAADGRSGRSLAADLRRGSEPEAADLYAETEYPRLLGWAALAALRRGGHKLIASPAPELFDLDADPGEMENLATRERRTLAPLRARLEELRRDAVDLAVTPLDEEGRRALAALGYVSGPTPERRPGEAADPKRMAPLFARFESAREAMDSGRLAEAVAELAQLVDADPGNPVFRGTRAVALGRLGEKGLAVEELRRSLTGGPGDLQTLYDLALAMHGAGLRREAETTLGELLRRDPDHAEAWNARGLLTLERGDLAAATASFERATQLDPGDANAFANLGNALRAAGRGEDAERALRRAIALAPDWADPLNGLGALEVARGRAAEGLALFDRALALDPGRHEARLNRAIALDTLGRREDAAAAYREFLAATAREPGFADQRRIAAALLARLSRG